MRISIVATFDEVRQGLAQLSASSLSPDNVRELYTECMHLPEGWTTADWANDRDIKLGLLLQFLALAKKLQDPNVRNEKIIAYLNPPVPPNSDIIPGQDPSQVKDPKERADYEKLIADNNANMKVLALQGALSNVAIRCFKYSQFYIKTHYSPAERDTVKQIIQQNLGNLPEADTLIKLNLQHQ